MPCIVIYSCKMTQVGTLVYHNLIINGEKWYYADSDNPTNSQEEIIKKATDESCIEGGLIIAGFTKGWVKNCSE